MDWIHAVVSCEHNNESSTPMKFREVLYLLRNY
jgi:hypothetical protein